MSEKERWRKLAEAVMVEQDPDMMTALVEELNRIIADPVLGDEDATEIKPLSEAKVRALRRTRT
jgi:hypothetical protein